MKNIYKSSLKYLLLCLTVGVFSACNEDFLEVEPSTSISQEEVFNSFVTAHAALIGVYDQFSSPSFEGHYIPMMGDVVGEDVLINSSNNYGWFIPVYQLEVLPNYFYASSVWNQGYKVIYDATKIIENTAKLRDLNVATEGEIDQLEGEAKVLRAYTMLRLVQMYAPAYSADRNALGILNVNRIIGPNDPDIGRATVGEIYDQIVLDLQGATELLRSRLEEDDLGNQQGEEVLKINQGVGFFNKQSAQGVLARAYLDMQDWEKARDAAIAAREGAELMLSNHLLQGFYGRNDETIFSLQYTVDDNNVYLTIPSFYYPVAGYSSMRVSKDFYNSFDNSDARRRQMLWQDNIDPDNYLILKFLHNGQIGNAERICMRASEMYLIEAECEAELGNDTEAQEALYQIQSRANALVQRPELTGDLLMDEILMERRRELFGEGFRWNDIKRRQQRFVRASDHWEKFDFGPEDDEYNALTFPIPQGEIDANSALSEADQNDGY